MKKVIIRQATKDCNYHFRYWDLAKEQFNISDYKTVYECERPDTTMLEDIFTEFNLNLPSDFRGHSLSVSDIVQLDDRIFYCDSFGWEDVTNIVKNG